MMQRVIVYIYSENRSKLFADSAGYAVGMNKKLSCTLCIVIWTVYNIKYDVIPAITYLVRSCND